MCVGMGTWVLLRGSLRQAMCKGAWEKVGGCRRQLVGGHFSDGRGWRWVCVCVLCGHWEGENTEDGSHEPPPFHFCSLTGVHHSPVQLSNTLLSKRRAPAVRNAGTEAGSPGALPPPRGPSGLNLKGNCLDKPVK